jgi:hypothetical protein
MRKKIDRTPLLGRGTKEFDEVLAVAKKRNSSGIRVYLGDNHLPRQGGWKIGRVCYDTSELHQVDDFGGYLFRAILEHEYRLWREDAEKAGEEV